MKEWRQEALAKVPSELNKTGIHPVLLALLYKRGFSTTLSLENFLNFKLDKKLVRAFSKDEENPFYDPFLFYDMEKAVALIISHIKQKNLIVVYGDYDADGVTSAVILLETLQILHAKTEVYLPDRVSEGYGLNKAAIKQMAEAGAKLIITVDSGIRNKAEVAYAKDLGLDVIITDHHVLPDKRSDLPDCLIINPADNKNNYPCPFLAGVGVSFKLISALLFKANLEDKQKELIANKALDLVALGTIADMVSLLDENRLLVKRGLEVLNKNKRLGINQLLSSAGINTSRPLEAWNIGWQIGPRLNAASRLSHANTAFGLLSTEDEDEAYELAEELNRRNASRQEITKEIMAQVEAKIDVNNLPEIIISVASIDEIWNEGVIGLVAGKIAEKYYRPTLIVTRLIEELEFDKESKKMIAKKVSFKGSGRSIPELNLIEQLTRCAPYLDKYGGHPMACGFSIKDEKQLELFSQEILKLVQKELAGESLVPKLNIEAELQASDINLELAQELNKLAPFGQNNPQPTFVSYGLKVEDIVLMGQEKQHIKIKMLGIFALCFGGAQRYADIKIGDIIDLVYYLEINQFNGRKEVQLKIIDLHLKNS